jgi:NTP pyrophosphatase (non-canonical NTP hydrolase)
MKISFKKNDKEIEATDLFAIDIELPIYDNGSIEIYWKNKDNQLKQKRYSLDHVEKIEFYDDDTLQSVNQFANQVHQNAVDHGWWDEKRSFGDICSLIHSEVSEAFEEHRNGNEMHYIFDGKPEGVAVELIDVVIRIFDYLASEKIDIKKLLLEKHSYNKSRPFKHGGKKL